MPTEPGLHERALETDADELNVVVDDPLLIFPPESESAVRIAEPAEGVLIPLTSEVTRELSVPATQPGSAESDYEGRALAELRAQIRQTEMAVRQSVDDTVAIRNEVDQLRESAEQLAGEYRSIAAISYEAHRRSVTVLETVQEIERRIGCDERLEALCVLADDVMRKTEALESQKDVIERAGVEARRVIQIVSTMETRLATLNDEDHLAGRAETMLARLEQIAAETSKQFEQIENVKCGLESKLSDFEKEVQALSASARSHLEQCMAQKKALLTGSRAIGLGRRQPFAPLVRHRRTVLAALGAATLVGLVVELNHARPYSADTTVVATRNPIPTASAMGLVDATPRHEVSTVAPVASPVVPILPPVLRSSRGPLPPRSQARRQEFSGTLTVESEPSGAAVFIDRQSVGQTPLNVARRRAGSHVVWIERQGYRRWTAAVRVAADKITRISASLQPDPHE